MDHTSNLQTLGRGSIIMIACMQLYSLLSKKNPFLVKDPNLRSLLSGFVSILTKDNVNFELSKISVKPYKTVLITYRFQNATFRVNSKW